MKNKDEKRTTNKNFLDAWVNAINGIIYATTTQGNIKKQLIIIVITIIVSLFFELSKVEFLCLIFSVALIIIIEMVNTAIETVVDLYTDIYHPKAKIAKDVGAGAVVLAAINAVVVAYFLFFDKISSAGMTVLESLIKSPEHLAFTTVILTAIAVVALKAANVIRKKKSIEEKFIPSGASTIAFACSTAIWLTTRNMVGFTLSLILALLVAFSRYDKKGRTAGEIIFGSVCGVIIASLVYGLTFFNL